MKLDYDSWYEFQRDRERRGATRFWNERLEAENDLIKLKAKYAA